MKNKVTRSGKVNPEKNNVNLLGFYTAIATTVLTVVTFGIAILTPPLSGPYAREAQFTYPFLDIVSRFPRDYYWMYPAILLTLVFVVLIVCIHHYAPREKKIYSHIGLSLALISASLLVTDYFIQISVIQPGLINGETDGIPILTQYNPHGIFIALEDAGYLLMSAALLFTAPVFSGANSLERGIRRVLITGFILTVVALVIISVSYGIHREYRFEVAAITINWMVLIIAGMLLSVLFRRAIKSSQ